LDDFNESIRLQPGDSLAYHMRGVVHRNLGDSAAALADFNEAIRRSPRDAAPRLNRSSLLESLGRLDEVLQEIEILLTLDMPDWAREEVAQRRARALAARDTGNELSQFPRRFEAGEFAAVEEAATAMLRGGRSEEAHLWRAACRLRRGDVEGALADLEIGLTSADRAYQNGWELFRENRIPAAVAECRRARTRHAAAEVWVSWLETRA
jgi:tetratricopeptide (TPR) repeat protein